MKKVLLILAVVTMTFLSANAQDKNVAKECVLFELFTGVRCPYCPAAANAVAQLLSEGKAIAPVAYHTSAFSTPPYYTTETNARASYYGVSSYPTLKADGTLNYSGGGSASETNYGTYLSLYNQRINQTSPFTIELTCDTDQEGHCIAHCVVNQVGDCSASNLRLMVALTQCNIDQNWQGMQGLHHVCRDMIPTQTGTVFTGPTMSVDLPFDLNWPKEDCYLTAWIQSYSTKEVFQAVRLSLDLQLDYDMAIKGVERYAAKNCSGMLAPKVKVKNVGNETVTSFDVVARAEGVELVRETMTCSLAKGETAYFTMSEFSKGDAQEITLQIENPNGHADQFMLDNVQSVSFETTDVTDGTIIMMLKTDLQPEETSVEVQNIATGEVVYEFHFDLPRHTYTETLSLMNAGYYRFTIKDSAGDGLGSSGFFTLMDAQEHELFYLTYAFDYEYPYEIYCDGTLSVEEKETFVPGVYPNPSHGSFNVLLGEGEWQVEVFDVTGKTVYKKTVTSSDLIQLDACGAGVYFLKATNGSEEIMNKVMVY